MSSVNVRDLGNRWGSCGEQGINYHWRVITLPPRIIDYVVVHELIHVREPHHTTEFWRRLARALPDFERHKEWLASNGAHY